MPPFEGRAILAFLSEVEVEGYRRYMRKQEIELPGSRSKLWSDLEELPCPRLCREPPARFDKGPEPLWHCLSGALPENPLAALGIIGPVVEADFRSRYRDSQRLDGN